MIGRVVFRWGANVVTVAPEDLFIVEDRRPVDEIFIVTKFGGSITIETDADNAYEDVAEDDARLASTHDAMIDDLTNPHREADFVEWTYKAGWTSKVSKVELLS